MKELKPCPFCEATPEKHPKDKNYLIIKHKERCFIEAVNVIVSVDDWNTRPAPSKQALSAPTVADLMSIEVETELGQDGKQIFLTEKSAQHLVDLYDAFKHWESLSKQALDWEKEFDKEWPNFWTKEGDLSIYPHKIKDFIRQHFSAPKQALDEKEGNDGTN